MKKIASIAAIVLAAVCWMSLPSKAGSLDEVRSSSELSFESVSFPGKFESSSHNRTFPPRDGDISDGWELAGALCRTLGSGQERCLSIVRRSRHFSIDAVLACGRVRSDSEKLFCVELIADHQITSSQAKRCAQGGSHNNDIDRAIVTCIQDIVDRIDPVEVGGPWSKPGLQEAHRLCAEMRYEVDRKLCLPAVTGARYFPLEGVQTCALRWHDSQKTACLRLFRDKYLQPDVLRVCAGLGGVPNRHRTNDQEKIACMLSGASDEPFRHGPSEDPQGMSSAVRLCSTLRFEDRKPECTRVIALARFFSFEAVEVCYGMISDGYKIQCLDAIKDSYAVGPAVRSCMNMKYEPEKINCLRSVARYR